MSIRCIVLKVDGRGSINPLPLLFKCSCKLGPCKRTKQVTTLLRVVGQQCCVRLYGPKSLTGFKLYATSANNVMVPCKRTHGNNNVACCCTTMLRPFAWALTGLNSFPFKASRVNLASTAQTSLQQVETRLTVNKK